MYLNYLEAVPWRTLCTFCLQAVLSADFMYLIFRGCTFGGLHVPLEAVPWRTSCTVSLGGYDVAFCTFGGIYTSHCLHHT